jgi:hypothetical protein
MPKPKPKPKKGKKTSSKDDKGMNDWIASLAKQSAASASTGNNIKSNNKNDISSHHPSSSAAVPSKEERIQKRANKKARRQLRQEDRQPREEDRQSRTVAPPVVHTHATAAAAVAGGGVAKMPPSRRVSDREATKRRLKSIAELILTARREHPNNGQRQPLYTPDEDSNRIKRKRALNEMNIQPQPSDYNGIGLARKSLYLPLQDPSHIPKLEEEFKEHIPGFFGKQRTKAMKRQLDGNMLWRKLADHKQNKKGGPGIPKKFEHLSPDQRVQAMIDAGML